MATKIPAKTMVLLCLLSFAPLDSAYSDSPDSSPSASPPASDEIRIGDRLSVSFFEPISPDKFASSRNPGPSFYRHQELSGDFIVGADRTIAVPILGHITVVNQNTEQVEQAVVPVFSKLIGHPGYVSVAIVARAPIFVLGAVKTSGKYAYEPGMTPLAAVALAGGIVRRQDQHDRWNLVEAVQMAGKKVAAMDRLGHAWAQVAVLRAELNNEQVHVPRELVQLVGQQTADDMIASEKARRGPVIQARNDRMRALQSAVDTANHAVTLDQSRLPPLETAVTLNQTRVKGLTFLRAAGRVDNNLLTQASTELLQAQDRKSEVMAGINKDQSDLAAAKLEEMKFTSDNKADLDTKIASLQREIDTLTPEAITAAGVIALMKPNKTTPDDDENLRFDIVRDGHDISADISTPVYPGDIVRVTPLRPVVIGSEETGHEGFVHTDPN